MRVEMQHEYDSDGDEGGAAALKGDRSAIGRGHWAVGSSSERRAARLGAAAVRLRVRLARSTEGQKDGRAAFSFAFMSLLTVRDSAQAYTRSHFSHWLLAHSGRDAACSALIAAVLESLSFTSGDEFAAAWRPSSHRPLLCTDCNRGETLRTSPSWNICCESKSTLKCRAAV